MRFTYFLLLVLGLSSCSLYLDAEPKTAAQQAHSTQRADYGKYITEETRVAGSRKLFVQPGGKNCLNSSKAVSAYLGENFHEKNRDAVLILLLDGKNQVMCMEEIESVALNAPSLTTSRVAQKAADLRAASVILVQCLPARTSTPYSQVREFSKDLKRTLNTVNVELLDHLIVGRNACYSFADNHLL